MAFYRVRRQATPAFSNGIACASKSISAALTLCAAALALALGVLACAGLPGQALAEEVDGVTISDKYQQEVERTTAEYQAAQDQLDAAEKAVADNEARIADLEQAIPEQQERSSKAAREQYKLQQQRGGVIELLFGSDDFASMLMKLDYVARISEANVDEMNRLSDMKGELESCRKDLVAAQWDAQVHQKEAKEALDAAKEARRQAQLKAQEEARRQAEAAERARQIEAAKAAALAAATVPAAGTTTGADAKDAASAADSKDSQDVEEKPSKSDDAAKADEPANDDGYEEDFGDDEDKVFDGSEDADGKDSTDGSSTSDSGSSSASGPKAEAEAYDNNIPLTTPTDDGADWTADQKTFVKEWGARIDAFLAGSALDGQGATFAKAAWKYGIDPRWSPAIANTESSLGAHCFLPHNAWGWGQSSWSSWEEAIDAHVGGLSRGYGYTITVAAAQTYCPPNWAHWYNDTIYAMNSI